MTPSFGIVPRGGVGRWSPRALTPTTAATATLELEVRVAQFGFEPFVCRVRGVGFPANVPRELRPSRDPRAPGAPQTFATKYSGLENKTEDVTRYDPRTPAVRKPKPPDAKPFRADALVAAFELRAAGYAKADAEALVKRGIGPRGRKLSARAVRALGTSPRPRRRTGRTRPRRTATRDEGATATKARRSSLRRRFVLPEAARRERLRARPEPEAREARVKDIEKAMAARDGRASGGDAARVRGHRGGRRRQDEGVGGGGGVQKAARRGARAARARALPRKQRRFEVPLMNRTGLPKRKPRLRAKTNEESASNGERSTNVS